MGLLDDAIREHLELKRRRGADAEEVTRLEQEALGPPQRGEFAAAAAPTGPAEPVDAPPIAEPDADPVVAVQAEPAPEVAEPPPIEEAAPPVEDAAPPVEDAAPPVEDAAPPVEEAAPPIDEPEPRGDNEAAWLEDEPPAPAGDPLPAHLDQPTAEYAPPAEAPPEGEDVLEETPDFLQETPEHDRLWFEQKPPRDFDLDR